MSANVYKKTPPPPGPLLNSWSFCRQTTRENLEFSDFCVFQLSAHFSLVSGLFCRKIILKIFWNSEGVAKKQGKNKGVFGRLVSWCFFSISFPHGHLSSSYTLLFANVLFILAFLLLLLCFSSLRWLCFIVSFRLCLYCALYFSLCCFSFLHSLFVWQKKPDQITEYLKIWFSCSASVPCHVEHVEPCWTMLNGSAKNVLLSAVMLNMLNMLTV